MGLLKPQDQLALKKKFEQELVGGRHPDPVHHLPGGLGPAGGGLRDL
jgi:hypothetical protein